MSAGIPTLDPFGDDEILRAVMAAIDQLDPAKQQALLKTIQIDLQLGDLVPNSAPSKLQRALAALVEASALNGEEPLSRDRFVALRLAHGKKGEWPDDRSIRRWLGASTWNDALRRARLAATPDGDAIVRQVGPHYKKEEIDEALRDCARDRGVPPTFDAYIAWARRPDIQALPGRRPMSQNPFDRYGGFLACLESAGLIDRTGSRAASGETTRANGIEGADTSSGLIRSAAYFVPDNELRSALHEVAARLRHPPRVTEYACERQAIFEETSAAGQPRALPAYNTFHRRHGDKSWDEILMHYGLDPLGGRHTGKRTGPKGPTGEQLDRGEMLIVLREAWEAHARKLTVAAFRKWRVEQTLRDRAAGVVRRIPEYTSYLSYFGNWEKALRAAVSLPVVGDEERDAGGDPPVGDDVSDDDDEANNDDDDSDDEAADEDEAAA